jgi:hypothetical protein
MRYLAVALLALPLASCGGGSGGPSGPVAGKIGGLPWTVMTAHTVPFATICP